MYRGLVSAREFAMGLGIIAVATAAALALGHGQYYTAVAVLFLMTMGMNGIVITRERAAAGRGPMFGAARDWLIVLEFGTAAALLAATPWIT